MVGDVLGGDVERKAGKGRTMKEYIILPYTKFQNKYTAIMWDENNLAPGIYIGAGKTAEEALNIARERCEEREND